MEQVQIQQIAKSLELKDILLVKMSALDKSDAQELAQIVKCPVILVKDFDDISSISITDLENIIEKYKNA